MNDAIADFIEYLTQTKKYSAHTAIGYETDVRDFPKRFGPHRHINVSVVFGRPTTAWFGTQIDRTGIVFVAGIL